MLPARALLAISLCVWATSCTGGHDRQDLSDAVAGLVADLDSRDPTVRREAVAALGALRTEAGPAAPALIELLTDPDAEVRMAATTALGDMGSPAVPVLIEALGDDDTLVRRGAAYALGKMGSPAQPAVPALVEMLDGEPDGRARAYVIWSLSRIGLPAEEAKSIIEEACTDPEPVVRRTALEALPVYGVPAADAMQWLQAGLDDPDPDVRRYAVGTLGDHYAAEARDVVERLIELLSDPNHPVRQAIFLRRWERLEADAVPLWIAGLECEDPAVREQALGAIHWMAGSSGKPDSLREIRPALAVFLGESDLEIRRRAAEALGRIGVADWPEIVPALTTSLRDEDPEVRRWALIMIEDLGPAAESAKEAVWELVADADETVRRRAGDALTAIERSDTPADINQLMAQLRSPFPEARRAAAKRLANLGARSQEAWPALVEALGDEDWEVVRYVGRVLAELSPDEELLQAIAARVATDSVTDEGAWQVLHAARGWGHAARNLVPALVKLEYYIPIEDPELGSLFGDLDKLNWDPRQTFSTLLGELVAGSPEQRPLTAVALSTMIEMSRYAESYEGLPKVCPPEELFALAESTGRVELWLETLVTSAKTGNDGKRARALEALGRLEAYAQPVVPELLPLLKEPGASLRLSAAKALGRMGSSPAESARDALIELLEEEDSFIRCEACLALSRLGEVAHSAIPILASRLGDSGDCGKTWVGSAAAHALWKLGPPSVPSLVEALNSEQSAVREQAAWAVRLIVMDHQTVEALPALKAAMSSPEDSIRSAIAEAIGALGPAARSADRALIDALSLRGAESPGAIAEALRAIGADPRRAVPLLLENVSQGNSYSQKRTAQAIRDFGVPPEELPRLLSSLEEQTPEVRYLLLLAVGGLGEAAEPAVAHLIQALKDPDSNARMAAARGLGEIGAAAAEAVLRLTDTLKDPACQVRAAAAEALGGIGPAARDAVPALEASLNDTGNCLVVFHALQSLPAIDPEASVPILVGVLREHPDGLQRVNATGLLGNLGEIARPALPALREAAVTGSSLLREAAQEAIQAIEKKEHK